LPPKCHRRLSLADPVVPCELPSLPGIPHSPFPLTSRCRRRLLRWRFSAHGTSCKFRGCIPIPKPSRPPHRDRRFKILLRLVPPARTLFLSYKLSLVLYSTQRPGPPASILSLQNQPMFIPSQFRAFRFRVASPSVPMVFLPRSPPPVPRFGSFLSTPPANP